MDDDVLGPSLAELSGVLTGHRPLRETLAEIAQFAVQAIPGAQGAGLTMHEDDLAVRVGELFVRPSAVSVHNAQVLASSQRLTAELGQALTSRAVIDQALGSS